MDKKFLMAKISLWYLHLHINIQAYIYPLSILEHFNYFGIDENLGPVAISLKREKNEESVKLNNLPLLSPPKVQYRFIVRTSEVSPAVEYDGGKVGLEAY